MLDNLIAVALAFKAGRATTDQLVEALRAITLYALRPAHPGLFLFQAPNGSSWTSAFTSLERLARHLAERGTSEPADYFSTTGGDVLDNLVPPNAGLLIDPGDEHAVALPPHWRRSAPKSPA